MSTTVTTVSEKRLAFIRTLLTERDVDRSVVWAKLAEDGMYPGSEDTDGEPTLLTNAQASRLIDHLKSLPYRQKSTQGVITATEGFYMHEGAPYRVDPTLSGRVIAKRLEGTKWVYAKGAIYRLTEAERLTEEQAREFGLRTGVCAICGRTLTAEASVERGIGPVCIQKMGW